MSCTTILDMAWKHLILSYQQEHYQYVADFIYWTVLGIYNTWNIFNVYNKYTPSEELNEIQNLAIDDRNNSMSSLVDTCKYGDISKTDTSTMGYYLFITQLYCDKTTKIMSRC